MASDSPRRGNDSMADMLFWTDIETTGLSLKDDRILEFAAIITDDELTELGRFQCYLPRSREAIAAWSNMEPVVVQMHQLSGLADDWWASRLTIIKDPFNVLSGVSGRPNEVLLDQILTQWITTTMEYYNRDPSPNEPLDRVVLAGAGVSHFEDEWYAKWFPKTFERFHYRSADLSVVRSTLKTLLGSRYPAVMHMILNGTSEKDDIAHRALADVEQSIENARILTKNFVEVI
jgi:oligoribonuclease